MPLLVTDAVVLHAFDYLETSRILRLATREAGIQSVVAKGARRPRSKFGTALDLFAQGSAHIHTRPGRDLQTLASFDVARSRSELGADLDRFTAASAIAELALRFGGGGGDGGDGDPGESLYDAIVDALDTIAGSAIGVPNDARAAALAGAWRLIAELGFAPTLDICGTCHDLLPPDEAVTFSHPAGGALCARCALLRQGARTIPPAARDTLRGWLSGETMLLAGDAESRAHQRLLREFVGEHLGDGRELRAFGVWERERWSEA